MHEPPPQSGHFEFLNGNEFRQTPPFTSSGDLHSNILSKRNKAILVDKISRWTFPLSFIILNIIYWTFYLSDWADWLNLWSVFENLKLPFLWYLRDSQTTIYYPLADAVCSQKISEADGRRCANGAWRPTGNRILTRIVSISKVPFLQC